MKKIITLTLALAFMSICVLGLSGCSDAGANSQDEQKAVYSFHGGDGQISVSNGTIVLGENEVFDGETKTYQLQLTLGD